jgi:hypothetical protein
MKKTIFSSLAAALVLSLCVSCGPDRSSNDQNGGAKKTNQSLDPDVDPDHDERWTDTMTIDEKNK